MVRQTTWYSLKIKSLFLINSGAGLYLSDSEKCLYSNFIPLLVKTQFTQSQTPALPDQHKKAFLNSQSAKFNKTCSMKASNSYTSTTTAYGMDMRFRLLSAIGALIFNPPVKQYKT